MDCKVTNPPETGTHDEPTAVKLVDLQLRVQFESEQMSTVNELSELFVKLAKVLSRKETHSPSACPKLKTRDDVKLLEQLPDVN